MDKGPHTTKSFHTHPNNNNNDAFERGVRENLVCVHNHSDNNHMTIDNSDNYNDGNYDNDCSNDYDDIKMDPHSGDGGGGDDDGNVQ